MKNQKETNTSIEETQIDTVIGSSLSKKHIMWTEVFLFVAVLFLIIVFIYDIHVRIENGKRDNGESPKPVVTEITTEETFITTDISLTSIVTTLPTTTISSTDTVVTSEDVISTTEATAIASSTNNIEDDSQKPIVAADLVYEPVPIMVEPLPVEPPIFIEPTVVETETVTENVEELVMSEETEEVVIEEPQEEEPVEEESMTYLGNLKITGYVATGNPTASGVYPYVGGVAMSRSYGFPWGTKIYIDGLGTFELFDCGCAYGVVDVFRSSEAECYALTSYRDVYVIN